MSALSFARRLRLVGLGLAVGGLLCVGSGVALTAWRVFAPQEAVLLPPGFSVTLETPTPGVLQYPVSPPPPRADVHAIPILPVSELPTATPTAAQESARRTPAPSYTPSPSVTASPSATSTLSATLTLTSTPTPLASRTHAVSPSATLVTPTVVPTARFTPQPTLSPTKSLTPVAALVPQTIRIDAIDLEASIVPVGQHPLKIGSRIYSQWIVPNEFAAGWHQNSAPLGQPGNTVLNGHHNVYGAVFRRLIDLKPGDIIELTSGDVHYVYLVAQTLTLLEEGQSAAVREENARWILPTTDERVTLVTCWPPEGNTHRFVVVALPLTALGQPAEIP